MGVSVTECWTCHRNGHWLDNFREDLREQGLILYWILLEGRAHSMIGYYILLGGHPEEKAVIGKELAVTH